MQISKSTPLVLPRRPNVSGDTPVEKLANLEAQRKSATNPAPIAEPYCFRSVLGFDDFTPAKTLAEQGALPNKAIPWRKVSLDFARFPLTDEHLGEIAQFIESQAVFLQYLKLNLSECGGQASQAGIEKFFKSLENKNELETLAINLGSSAFVENDETLVALGKSVDALHALEGFSLDITDNNFTDEGLAGLFSHLSEAVKLNEVHLDLSKGKQINEQTFQKIANAVSQSESLKKLSLDFSKVKGLNDEASQYIGWILGRMAKAPEEFNVNISGTACTNDSLKNIAGSSQSAEIKRLNIYAHANAAMDRTSHEIVNGYSDQSMTAKLYAWAGDYA